MTIRRYEKALAQDAHNDTIKAHAVFPKDSGFSVPFETSWGFLDGPGELEPHAHPTDEIYTVCRGNGMVTVGGESAPVGPGDVIEIPGNVTHSIKNEQPGELLWFAFWWEKV